MKKMLRNSIIGALGLVAYGLVGSLHNSRVANETIDFETMASIEEPEFYMERPKEEPVTYVAGHLIEFPLVGRRANGDYEVPVAGGEGIKSSYTNSSHGLMVKISYPGLPNQNRFIFEGTEERVRGLESSISNLFSQGARNISFKLGKSPKNYIPFSEDDGSEYFNPFRLIYESPINIDSADIKIGK